MLVNDGLPNLLVLIQNYLEILDKRLTRKFTDVHYFIMPDSEEPECVQTNVPEIVDDLLSCDLASNGLIEVGFLYYTYYCISRGLGIILPPRPPTQE